MIEKNHCKICDGKFTKAGKYQHLKTIKHKIGISTKNKIEELENKIKRMTSKKLHY